MWSAIILNCILSLTIIFIANHIWDYCKINYTSQKTKNLVEIHASKYKQIAEDMERNMVSPKEEQPQPQPQHFIQKEEKEWIHKELTEFIETL